MKVWRAGRPQAVERAPARRDAGVGPRAIERASGASDAGVGPRAIERGRE